jgi:epoxyqueuosine reductase QueG
MRNLSEVIKKQLLGLGADMVGFGDLSMLPEEDRKNMPFGISVAIAYLPQDLKGIEEGPTEDYYRAYMRIDDKIDSIITEGADYLKSIGYEAIAQTIEEVAKVETKYDSILPHKTVATRAGMGWIGKNALLVTRNYGSAIRISTILTNAPLTADIPIDESNCKDCRKCMEECPGEAVKGMNWSVKTGREELFDPVRCRAKARELSWSRLGREITLCGKCILVCPFTQRYLRESMKAV